MSFESITQAHLHRAALAVGIRALLADDLGGFEGDAREGSVYFEPDDHVSIRASWCAEGAVAVAFDNYAQGEVPGLRQGGAGPGAAPVLGRVTLTSVRRAWTQPVEPDLAHP